MEFRSKALATLRAPEEIDLPVRFARPRGLLALLLALAVLAGGAGWAFAGEVTTRASASGVLTYGQGAYVLQSPYAGQVTAVRAAEGARVAKGAPLADVRTDAGTRSVDAPAAGRVTALTATLGSVLDTGSDVARLERTADPDAPLLAMLYLPAGQAAAIRSGARAEITADTPGTSARTGEVTRVGRTPLTRARLATFLGDPALAARLSADGRPVAVTVRVPDLPPSASGTAVTASVHLAAQRPVDWLLP